MIMGTQIKHICRVEHRLNRLTKPIALLDIAQPYEGNLHFICTRSSVG
jgi:hypothetical protein